MFSLLICMYIHSFDTMYNVLYFNNRKHNISGSHPTVAVGEVDATLVQAMTDQTMTAKVKNCNDEYYVYQLEPTSACPEAYCFGKYIMQTCPCNILQYFTDVKMVIFR